MKRLDSIAHKGESPPKVGSATGEVTVHATRHYVFVISYMFGSEHPSGVGVLRRRSLSPGADPIEATPRLSFVDDFGADLIATRSGERLVVQAKKTSSSIGRPTLQKLQGAALHFHGKPVLATTGKFSGPAREYAIIHGIELIDGETLIEKLIATFSKRT